MLLLLTGSTVFRPARVCSIAEWNMQMEHLNTCGQALRQMLRHDLQVSTLRRVRSAAIRGSDEAPYGVLSRIRDLNRQLISVIPVPGKGE